VRDGSTSYAAAITQAHPDAIQVNDRFHILKNLTDYSKKVIRKEVPQSFRIQTEADTQGAGNNSWEKEENHGENQSTVKHLTSLEKKQAQVEQMRFLAMEGFSV
jgi:transposase